MILQRTRGLNLLHGCVLCGATLLLFWSWIFLITCLKAEPLKIAEDRYCIYSLLVIGAFLLEMVRNIGINANLIQLDLGKCHSLAFRQTLTVIGTLLLFLVATKDGTISRVFLFSFVPLLYFMLFCLNRSLPRVLATFVFSGGRKQKSVLMGSTVSVSKLERWLERKIDYGFETVGIVTQHGTEEWHGKIPVLGQSCDIENVLRETGASQLIVLQLPERLEEVVLLNDLCDRLGVRLLLVNDLEEKLQCSISFIEDDGFHFLGLRHEPLECPWNRMVKRSLDIAIALPIVVFLLPLVTIFVWIFQSFQSPGPLFFRQRRTGLHKREFTIFKYRTMHTNNDDEARQATSNDPRVYPAGRWFRKLNVDELPQFINVLQGDMSVVGPRPHLAAHDSIFGEIATDYRVRSFVKPGITGLAQVRGLRGEAIREIDMIDRVRSDVYYLENWSFLLDWLIIGKTAWQVLFPPKTAY